MANINRPHYLAKALCSLPLCCPSVYPPVCYQTREHVILKTNEPTVMQIGTSGMLDLPVSTK